MLVALGFHWFPRSYHTCNACTHVRMCVCTHVCMQQECKFLHIYLYVCMYVCMYVYIYIRFKNLHFCCRLICIEIGKGERATVRERERGRKKRQRSSPQVVPLQWKILGSGFRECSACHYQWCWLGRTATRASPAVTSKDRKTVQQQALERPTASRNNSFC